MLFLSIDGISDPLGQSQILPYLKALEARGHEISVLSLEKKERYQALGLSLQHELKGKRIFWHPVTYWNTPPYLGPLLNFLRLYRCASGLVNQKAIDIIHARSYLPALAAIKLKRRFHVKFVFDMRGFWPDERVEGNIWNLSNQLHKWLYRFFKRKEMVFFAEADHVVSLTKEGKKVLLDKGLVDDENRISVIPCCVNVNFFDPALYDDTVKISLREKLGIDKDDFVLGYLGSLGTWYQGADMLRFFNRLHQKMTNARFLFITYEAQYVRQMARKEGVSQDRIVIINTHHAGLPQYLSIIDAGIIFIKPVFSKKASSPTKLGEMLSMGVPVITNAGVGDNDYLMETYKPGIVLSDLSDYAMKTVVADMPRCLYISGQHIRKAAINHFSLEKGVDTYHQIYIELHSDNGTETG